MTRSVATLDALHGAFSLLADPETSLGKDVRTRLAATTGLSAPMIEWALRTSLPTDRDLLANALSRAPEHGDRRVSVVLSGNLFTACIRALGWPLLLGASVTAKAASHDDVLPRALHQALALVNPEVAARLDVRTFGRTDNTALQDLVSDCDLVSAYGSDATLDAIQQVVPAKVPLVRHGHGVGALYIAGSALESTAATRQWLDPITLDIAAYDQRGCLSPHVVFVKEGCPVTPERFAQELATALTKLEGTLPRGALTEHDVIAQSQWRGLMGSCGDLVEASSFAVALLDPNMAVPSFTGPGYRNVCVTACWNAPTVIAQLTLLGEHLKCIGVAGNTDEVTEITDELPTTLRPTVCRAGEMQTPAFDANADGEPPWFGLV